MPVVAGFGEAALNLVYFCREVGELGPELLVKLVLPDVARCGLQFLDGLLVPGVLLLFLI